MLIIEKKKHTCINSAQPIFNKFFQNKKNELLFFFVNHNVHCYSIINCYFKTTTKQLMNCCYKFYDSRM